MCKRDRVMARQVQSGVWLGRAGAGEGTAGGERCARRTVRGVARQVRGRVHGSVGGQHGEQRAITLVATSVMALDLDL